MKRLVKTILTVMLSISLLPGTVLLAAEKSYTVSDDEKFHMIYENTENAVSSYGRNAVKSGLDWQWGLYVDGGWAGGFDVSAISGATSAVDYLYVKAQMFFKDGSEKNNENSAKNTDSCETSFHDQAMNDQVRKTSSFKSTHSFRHTGYTSTTKYVTRDLADIY